MQPAEQRYLKLLQGLGNQSLYFPRNNLCLQGLRLYLHMEIGFSNVSYW